jgi:hypothetical protein
MKYLVTWQSKPRSEPRDGLANGWRWYTALYETKTGAELHYRSLLPGPGGDFGPIEYRNITMARVVSVDCPHYWVDNHHCLYCDEVLDAHNDPGSIGYHEKNTQ